MFHKSAAVKELPCLLPVDTVSFTTDVMFFVSVLLIAENKWLFCVFMIINFIGFTFYSLSTLSDFDKTKIGGYLVLCKTKYMVKLQ